MTHGMARPMTIEVDEREAFAELSAILASSVPGERAIEVLEAGGGSLSHVQLPASSRTTVIDVSPEQLARNEYAHTKILGDLHTYDFEPSSFDVIVCWNVIEHLERPDVVTRSFARWLKPRGILVIAAPNPQSLTGLITKLTPHWFHVWVLRSVFGSATAGQAGHGPFPTYMHPAMYPRALAELLRREGLEIQHLRLYTSGRLQALRDRRPLLGRAFTATLMGCKALSLGRWPAEASDFHLVARRPA